MFIELDEDTWINSDVIHHWRSRTLKGKPPTIKMVAYDAEGNELGSINESRINYIRNCTAIYMPALPLDHVIEFHCNSYRKGEEFTYWVEQPRVYAWRIEPDGAEPVVHPVLAEDDLSWDHRWHRRLLPQPGGRFLDPFNCRYDTYEQAEEEIVAWLRKNWTTAKEEAEAKEAAHG